ncbi:uncharacterized protein [Montipora capricornis]|uniref:uncharacterized protein n=1 Tax=Montipora capricornis TaxID=246305 RepID=UPI0035F1F5A9
MSSSRANHALEKTNKTMSATGRKLMIVAVILLTLVIIVLIAGVVLIHKKIASLKDGEAKRHHVDSTTSNLAKRGIHIQRQIKGKQKPIAQEAKCQAISIPLCQNMSYIMGQFPNHLKQTQEEAKAWIDANEVTKLIHSGCSPDIGQLLCSILSPPCNAPGTLLHPCKEFCRRATKACKDEIKRYKLKSHPLMRCRLLQKEETQKCFDGSWQRNTAGCQQMPLKQCSKYITRTPSWRAQFPNYFGHMKEEAVSKLNQFDPIWQLAEDHLECASTLAHFLCNMYAPKCTSSETHVPPCKELCLNARSKCKAFFRRMRKENGFTWPKEVECKNFPRKGTAPCYMEPKPTPSPTTEIAFTYAPPPEKCEEITIPICKGLPYKMTRFPNHLNHTLQEEAALEVHQFWPLVEINCADDLKLFLCSLYAPPCVHANDSLPPCRSLCRNSKRGCEPLMNQYGFEWPKRMACEQFPELEKGGASCLSRPKETVQPSLPSTIRKGKCERMTVKLCRDLPYNMTMFPNYFNHTLQEEAALEVHQFWPLVEINCADDLKLFLCSLYAPPCVNTNDLLPPCRSLCSRVRSGCEPLMNQYGFEWPKNLVCEKFPEANGGKICLSRPNKTVQPSPTTTTRKGKCEDLNISLCQGLHYKKTQFPNDLNHVTQDEARLQVNQFFPLVAVNCSAELALFLCSLYAPRCNGPPLPCQELCNRVQNGCIDVIKQFGFAWPNQMTCNRFPLSGNGTDCVDASAIVESTTAVPSTTDG